MDMDIYTALRAYANDPAANKLLILRETCTTPLWAIHGFCALVQHPETIATYEIPSAILPWIDQIAAAARHIHAALNALTDPVDGPDQTADRPPSARA